MEKKNTEYSKLLNPKGSIIRTNKKLDSVSDAPFFQIKLEKVEKILKTVPPPLPGSD